MIRIASLLPSATEIVCTLGFADCLVGVSHECDYPPEVVADLPRLTRSAVPPGLSSAEIDADVAARLRRGESLYTVDEAQLAALAPDVIITQELCDVCAVNFSQVKALSARLPGRPKVISLTPPNLEGILEDVRTVAGVLGVPKRGERLVAQLRAQLAAVAESVRGQPRPRVFACEWLDPPYAAGHWVPEMVALAGGEEVLGRAGERSFRVTWEQVAAARPDVVVLIPCGYTREQAEAEWKALPKPAVLEDIPAVRNGHVYALEANNYCSRPAPRVVEGVEALARVFHAVTG
ncbi:MAG: cobalamin-binding protein [Anaerolineales bacterium]|nr:cobalamin-binding protein [Anaerolineales bacterium]